ncbi:protein-arginine deiminase family protein [Zobellia amurskyensis]|uniref:protein-arginine deiminase family protein n=1 Tax=Zobellia amurskyensis TaxID=248905 RepID=UPI001412CAA1|nr:protein-arginine deiminase family protein [Zobellia amurskyensis]
MIVSLLLPQKSHGQACVERKPISVAIAIDVSGSMVGIMDNARDFAVGLINGLNSTGNLNEVEVFLFNGTVPAYPLPGGEFVWGNPSSAVTWLGGLDDSDAFGGTALFDATYLGASLVVSRSTSNFKLFVLVTDGDDSGSTLTIGDATAALSSSGLVSRLIFIGNSSSGANTLNSMANGAGSGSIAVNSTPGDLNSLISSIVDATCINHSPVANFTISDSDLNLCTDGSSITFNGSGSNDEETSSNSLDYEWTISRPDGSNLNRTGRILTENFDDSQLNSGTGWGVSLTVRDAKNVPSSPSFSSFSVVGGPPDITLSANPSNPFDANITGSLEATPTNDCDGGGAMNFQWTVLNGPSGGVEPNPLNTPVISISGLEENITTYTDGTDFRTPWHFQCTATDNENDSDTEEITLRIYNIPPDINFIGDTELDIFFPIQVGTDILNDDDGGALTFSWDIVQAPNSSSTNIVDGFSTGPDFIFSTDDTDPGTWRLRLTATDNEGEEYEDYISVLVDGPPNAEITGPFTPIGTIFGFPLTLDGNQSYDPDTRNDLPNNGHSTSDPPIQDISQGIVSYSWSLIDAPYDNPNLFALGRVDEVLGINSSGPTLTIPFAKRLTAGFYTFLLEVEDGEGNLDSEEFQIEVIEEESRPLGFIIPPQQTHFVDELTNVTANDIKVYGGLSFDPDNLLSSPISEGIDNFTWSYQYLPSGCLTPPVLPSGPGAFEAVLYAAGSIVPLECQGLYQITLEVIDDDPIPKSNQPLATAVISIGNCPTNLCIDYPTTIAPVPIQFTEDTDVSIYFHLNSVLYEDPLAILGTVAKLEIFYESEMAPFYTAEDPNLLATNFGGLLSFQWNGYGDLNQRPDSGKYHVKITLLDQSVMSMIGGDDELNAILIAVADPAIDPTTDELIAREKLIASTDQLDVNYSITGGGIPDELRWRIFDAGNAEVASGAIPSPPNSGNFSWNGQNTVPEVVPAGDYELEIETFQLGSSMGKSARHPVTIFKCDLDSDTNRNGTIDDVADEINEENYTVVSGSIFNVNYDRDGSRTQGGMPINDVLFIDNSGTPTNEDKDIDNAADEADITPLVIRKIMNDIPPTINVYLKVAELEDIQSIHMFKSIAAGETAIWGGLGSRVIGDPDEPLEIDITSWVNPTDPAYACDPVSGDCTFGIEGMFFRNTGLVNLFDGIIDLTLEVREGATVLSSDEIQLKVAPYLMLSHLQGSTAVWVKDGGALNVEMRETASADPGYFALENSGQLQEVTDAVLAGNQWFQDHMEVGYYQRPGGPPNHIMLRLPYGAQPKWPNYSILGPGTGDFQLGDGLPGGGAGDFGGNLEILPPNAINPNGRVVIGSTRSVELFDFLTSQESQDPFTVNTAWLRVSHVDEIFGFTNNPNEMIVANPIDSYAILTSIPIADQGKSVFFATGSSIPESGVVTSAAIATNRINTGVDHTVGSAWGFIRIFEDAGSGAAGQVARISILDNGHILVDKVWLVGSQVLPIADPLNYGFWLHSTSEAPNQGDWFVPPDTGDKYVLVEGTRVWKNNTPAIITVHEILADSELEDLNLLDIEPEIATIRSNIEAANGAPMNFIQVPTIYVGDRIGFSSNRSCVALTPGLANFQLVNGVPYFPRQFGPKDVASNDIFEDAVSAVVPAALFTDDWNLYHRLDGEVHCGTNVIRLFPVFNWWNP